MSQNENARAERAATGGTRANYFWLYKKQKGSKGASRPSKKVSCFRRLHPLMISNTPRAQSRSGAKTQFPSLGHAHDQFIAENTPASIFLEALTRVL